MPWWNPVCLSEVRAEYDFIIVGAGTAGSTLAKELSGDPRSRGRHPSILVLEAGISHLPFGSKVPALYPLTFGTPIDWGYQTVRQAGMLNRRIPCPAGKLVGGSASINAMIRLEPSTRCLSDLCKEWGDEWTVAEVQKVFQDLETRWRGASPQLHENTDRFLEMACQVGLGTRESMRSPRYGIAPYVRMQSQSQRRTIEHWYRVPHASDAPGSIQLLANCCVQRLQLDQDRLIGVSVTSGNEEFLIRANEEVILCCGAMETPRLLFHSGIGPRVALEDAGIECKLSCDGIGRGFQDHLIYPIVLELKKGTPFNRALSDEDQSSFTGDADGLSSSNLAELGGFFEPGSKEPEGHQGEDVDTTKAFQWHITPTHYLAYPRIHTPKPCLSVGVTQCRPLSRGWIRPQPLRKLELEANPPRVPVRLEIDPSYFGEPNDLDRFVAAVEATREFLGRGPLGTIVDRELIPGPTKLEDPQVRGSILRYATTLYHYSSSCQMGVQLDRPVDTRFRLRGIEGLRICDASVLPSVLGCNPQTTLMMLAIRCADLLVRD